MEDIVTTLSANSFKELVKRDSEQFKNQLSCFKIKGDNQVRTYIGYVCDIKQEDNNDNAENRQVRIMLRNCIEVEKCLAWRQKNIYIASDEIVSYSITQDEETIEKVTHTFNILALTQIPV